MAGILSKGISLGFSTAATPSTYTNVANVQQIPSLGGDPEQVDVTCLADSNFQYIPGLKNFGELEFSLLFDNASGTSNFRQLKSLETAGTDAKWCVEFPDAPSAGAHGTQFKFSGKCAVSTDEAGVNNAITFKLRIFLSSDLDVTDPA